MVSSLPNLAFSLSRTVWVFTILFAPFTFAVEQSARGTNVLRSQNSNQDYSSPTYMLCQLPETQHIKWMKPFAWRSSVDILFGCLATLFACTWSILHLNLPGTDNFASRFARKTTWMAIALMFPELLACIALVEFWLARESKKEFVKAGFGHWTLKHGFFANMGGFVLQSSGRSHLPLNSETLEIIVKEKLVEVPTITGAEIQDKSKTDSFARVFSLLQVLWMVVQCIVRWYQQLYITPLEVLVACCILISFFTFLFEWEKPKDITVPTILTYDGVLDDELVERILAIYRHRYKKELKTTEDMTRIPFGATLHHLWNNDTKSPRWVLMFYFCLCFIGGVYNGLHLSVRQELFPPNLYHLWRDCCLVSIGVPFVLLICLFSTRNVSSSLSNSFCQFLLVAYGAARLVPFGLGLLCFWGSPGLPRDAYRNVDWTNYIPHF